MKKAIIIISLFSLAFAFGAVAEEPETTSVISGIISLIPGEDGQYQVMLTLQNGDSVVVDLPKGEVERLKLRDRDRLRIKGVFIGAAPDSGLRARLLARTMTKGLITYTIKDPVQLSERDRLQMRSYEAYRNNEAVNAIQAQTRTEEGTRSEAQARESASGGAGSGKP